MWKGEELLAFVPDDSERKIDWKAIENSSFKPWIHDMKQTQQNPRWHGEGDVWTHTKMVCESLIQLQGYRSVERKKQEILFLTALLHDIGKIPCTRMEDGHWVSPKHTITGSKMARELLWKEYGFCGTSSRQQFRETICQLIRYHSVPAHILEQEHPENRLLRMASSEKLLPDFTLDLLSIFVEADMTGRISQDIRESLELNEIFRLMAEENECLNGAAVFSTDYTEYACLSGRNVFRGQELYDDTWGEIVLMSGLPGTGKDTWIAGHLPEYPVVSLDEIRKELHILPTENQGVVVQKAKELAKSYLRKQQPFVWNATNLTADLRGKLIQLFVNYKAKVRIVYLETDWETQMSRNASRKEEVPLTVMEHMIKNMVPPEANEAHVVDWYCV